MEDDTEPLYLTFKTFDVTNRTLTSDTGAKDVVHALRPMEGATDYYNDPATLACDDDEMVFGRRKERILGRANTLTCPQCLEAVSLA